MPVSSTRAEQQIEDLALHRGVQRGRRFVGDHQIGLAGQRHRDHHALALSARQLVRVGGEPPRRLVDANAREQALCFLARRGGRHLRVRSQRPHHLRADGLDRVERRHRLLEHHRQAVAAQGAHLPLREGEQVAAVEHHAATGLRLLAQQPDQRQRGGRLAATRFADDAGHLPALQRERDAVDRPQRAVRRRQRDAQGIDFDQGHGVSGSARSVGPASRAARRRTG